jgi:Putative prokaryotic signal transducing protein
VPEHLRECLLASYAHMGEAMIAQNVLEAAGVPCRVGDLANIPSHLFGIAGAMGRSVGLWVLEIDLERATKLLESGVTENVDEDALAAEAMAAAPPEEDDAEGDEEMRRAPEPSLDEAVIAAMERAPPAIHPTHSPWLALAIFAVVVVVAALAYRGCN